MSPQIRKLHLPPLLPITDEFSYHHYCLISYCLKAVQSFYVESRACVRVGNDVSEWFPVNVG